MTTIIKDNEYCMMYIKFIIINTETMNPSNSPSKYNPNIYPTIQTSLPTIITSYPTSNITYEPTNEPTNELFLFLFESISFPNSLLISIGVILIHFVILTFPF